MGKMKNTIVLNGNITVEKINGPKNKKRVIGTTQFDLADVQAIEAWKPETIDMVKDLAAEEGFDKDTIEITNAVNGQYKIGIVYTVTGEINNITQDVIDEILEAEAQTKANNEKNLITQKKINDKKREIQELQKEMIENGRLFITAEL